MSLDEVRLLQTAGNGLVEHIYHLEHRIVGPTDAVAQNEGTILRVIRQSLQSQITLEFQTTFS